MGHCWEGAFQIQVVFPIQVSVMEQSYSINNKFWDIEDGVICKLKKGGYISISCPCMLTLSEYIVWAATSTYHPVSLFTRFYGMWKCGLSFENPTTGER